MSTHISVLWLCIVYVCMWMCVIDVHIGLYRRDVCYSVLGNIIVSEGIVVTLHV